MSNKNLHKAKNEKNDEFYTELSDIEKELKHYKSHFKDKVVFCNCDDPDFNRENKMKSNFFVYFAQNFEHLGLKKLIVTHYSKEGEGYKLEIDRDENADGKINALDAIQTTIYGNDEYKAGDFRSPDCIELLKQADIVVTNPPFSLFREYVAQLMEHDKKFLIIGNYGSCSYKEIFPLIKNNKIWTGVSPRSMSFMQPDGSKKSVNACWFTNLNHKKRNQELILYKKYSPKEYTKYDNLDAIDVEEVASIPMDYDGWMGVPGTFIENYNPNQFELIGIPTGNMGKQIGVAKNYRGRTDISIDNSRCPYSRIIIKRK